jgi:hypothetical protein
MSIKRILLAADRTACIPSACLVNTDLRRLRMIVGLARAHQDRPQATIKEHPNGQKAEQFQ